MKCSLRRYYPDQVPAQMGKGFKLEAPLSRLLPKNWNSGHPFFHFSTPIVPISPSLVNGIFPSLPFSPSLPHIFWKEITTTGLNFLHFSFPGNSCNSPKKGYNIL